LKGDIIAYRGGYKYSLWETYRVQLGFIRGRVVNHRLFTLDADGWLTIFDDYPWDGASDAFDTKTFMRGSLVHDALYEMLRLGLLPHDPCFHQANLELLAIILQDGMWHWRAQIVYAAVERFGNAAAALRSERICFAPRLTVAEPPADDDRGTQYGGKHYLSRGN